MNQNQLTFSICHLYPDLLNLYGDRGNILTLLKRCEWRGIEATVHSIGLGQQFDPDCYDLIFLGGGQDFEQSLISKDLVENKGEAIRKAVDSNKVFLCICGGYQMMGEYYLDQNGNRMDGLHAIPIWTEAGKKRLIGNMVSYSDELEKLGKDPVLIGFENHSGRTILGKGADPLARVQTGFGNNGTDGSEGARYKNVFCSYMHGSFLPKNPDMADHLIQTGLRVKTGESITLAPMENEFEDSARKHMQTYSAGVKKHKKQVDRKWIINETVRQKG